MVMALAASTRNKRRGLTRFVAKHSASSGAGACGKPCGGAGGEDYARTLHRSHAISRENPHLHRVRRLPADGCRGVGQRNQNQSVIRSGAISQHATEN